jgi:hypothetical protein
VRITSRCPHLVTSKCDAGLDFGWIDARRDARSKSSENRFRRCARPEVSQVNAQVVVNRVANNSGHARAARRGKQPEHLVMCFIEFDLDPLHCVPTIPKSPVLTHWS